MKIGIVLDDTLDKPDGVQAAVLDIGKELTNRGHEVHYLVTETTRKDIENIHSMAAYLSLPFNGNSVRTPKPANKKYLKKLLSELDLDVIHVQMPYSPFMAGRVISSVSARTKVFGTFHILPYDRLTSIGTKLLGMFLKKNLNKFDGFFAVSSPASEFMKETFGVESKVLPNPVNYQFFSSFKRELSDDFTVVFVGRFDERKGVRQLVEAFSMLPKTMRNDVRLIMCGKGPLLDEVRKRASELEINATFPGFVSDEEKAQYLANATIAVFPSTSGESFGIVLAEAMASGSSVTLGGDNPGYRSVLGNWPDVLFDPNDLEGFSRTLNGFIGNMDRRAEIEIEQHDYVKRFDIVNVVDKLEDAYQNS